MPTLPLFLGVVSKGYLQGMDLLDLVSYHIKDASGDRIDTQLKVFQNLPIVFYTSRYY